MTENQEKYNTTVLVTETEDKRLQTLLKIMRRTKSGLRLSSWKMAASEQMVINLKQLKDPTVNRFYARDKPIQELLSFKMETFDYENIFNAYELHCEEKGLTYSLGLQRFLEENVFLDYQQNTRGVL